MDLLLDHQPLSDLLQRAIRRVLPLQQPACGPAKKDRGSGGGRLEHLIGSQAQAATAVGRHQDFAVHERLPQARPALRCRGEGGNRCGSGARTGEDDESIIALDPFGLSIGSCEAKPSLVRNDCAGLEYVYAEDGEDDKHIREERFGISLIGLGQRRQSGSVAIVDFSSASLGGKLEESRLEKANGGLVERLTEAREHHEALPEILVGKMIVDALSRILALAYIYARVMTDIIRWPNEQIDARAAELAPDRPHGRVARARRCNGYPGPMRLVDEA